ncbi:MRPL51 [Candida oxycetoniae]|uniref:Large ribosomal subunit protein mL43 n=1 Tax=Candida oxycetoniae TaxID=497107 RepID=A0AAI9SU10_9ASCO|nr:MRPL51 [Candida oxycetoniae]KAI3403017.1 MRPL51 [Candida oxycetoniae]
MPVKAIARTSIARNGVGAYIHPCKKITLEYCNWGGSSEGLRQLLTSGELNKIASSKPQTIFEIRKRTGHPKLIFHYNNSDKSTKNVVDVRNIDKFKIIEKINEFSQRSGNELFKCNHKVVSNNESVRGIWSPLHQPKGHRYNI